MEALDGVEIRAFSDAASWERWLADNHGRHEGIWLKMAKKGSGIASVTSDELVDVGLCWGWISGQRRSLDATFYLQRYVPRRPRSMWSKVNVDKVEMLLASGRMREPGLAEVRAAQADGRWDVAYEPQSTAAPPPDVADALAADQRARAAFDALGKSAQYQAFLPVLQARNPVTRAARIQRMISVLGDLAGKEPGDQK